jgi:glycosyltransferase involved in cell wall biosynthesis
MPPTPILRLITWLPAGGIERKICAVLPRLNRDLFAPRLVCIREEGPLADDLRAAGIPVDVIPFNGRMDPFAMSRLRRYIRDHNIGLIHSHMYRASTPATLLSLLGRGQPPVIAHYHNVNTWETGRQAFLDGFLARRRMNVAVSEAVSRNVQSRLRLTDDQIRTLPNGVDTMEFRPRPESHNADIRQRFGLPSDALILVQVGRLVNQKNHRMTLQCLPHWLRAEPRLRLLLLGDGPLRQSLEKEVLELGLSEVVHFAGRIDDVAEVLPACDLVLLPSLREGFSNALLEAMACGLPVVASDVGGNAEAIVQNQSGVIVPMLPTVGTLVPEVNEVEFRETVTRLITDRPRLAAMGRAARDRSEEFSIERMVADIEALYLEILQKPARPIPVRAPVLVPAP